MDDEEWVNWRDPEYYDEYWEDNIQNVMEWEWQEELRQMHVSFLANNQEETPERTKELTDKQIKRRKHEKS
jgi:hypothetical protein